MNGERVCNWAILGTGVVSRKFALGLRPLGKAARVVTVASRDPHKAVAFADAFGIKYAARDYLEAVSTSDVDAVYIATPPSEHEAHALMAISAGKAVLVEKPFALDADAARRICEAAGSAGVFCMEAMWTRFLPLYARVRQSLDQGDLGNIRALQGCFMGSDRVDASASVFDPARGGGALMHRGVYPLSLARHLLGPITEVTAQGRLEATGVDEDCTLILHHQSGAISTVMASLRASGPNTLVVSGTEGMLEVGAPIFRPHRARLTRVKPRDAQHMAAGRLDALRESGIVQGMMQRLPEGLRAAVGGKSTTVRSPYSGNGYHYQAAEVALRLHLGALSSPVMPLQESVEIMSVIDRARAQFR